MEWLKKLLEQGGAEVSDELMDTLSKEAPKHWMPKREYNQKADEAKALKEQIAALTEQAGASEELKQELEGLKQQYQADTGRLNEQLKQAQFSGALQLAVATSGVRNPKALMGFLDMERLSFEEGVLSGFDEQLQAIRAENDYLFDVPAATGMAHGSGVRPMSGVESAFFAKNPKLRG